MGVLRKFFSYISQALGMSNKSLPNIPKTDNATSSGPETMMNLKRPQEQEFETANIKEASTMLLFIYQDCEEYTDAVVDEIYWYKSTETVQHEFVILKGNVTVMENGEAKKKDIYCKVERTANIAVKYIGLLKPSQAFPEEALNHRDWSEKEWKEFKERLKNEQERKAGGAALFSVSMVTSNASQTSIDLSRESSPSCPTYTTTALDTITRLRDNIAPFEHQSISAHSLATLSFHGQLPYFRDIILAASVISASNPVYNMMMSHCYWFVQAFIHVLEAKYHRSCTLHKHPDFDKKAGKMLLLKGRFPVLSPQTHKLDDEVQQLFKTLEDKIQASDVAIKNSPRATEARERAARIAAENARIESEERERATKARERAARIAAEKRARAAENARIESEERERATEAGRVAAEAGRVAAEERERATRIAAEAQNAALQQQIALLLASIPNRQDGKDPVTSSALT